MAKLFDLSIITPDETVYEGRVLSLVAPCALGYLGVLGDHSPLIANMTAGKITLKEEAGNSIIFNSETKGFLQVLKNKVSIILNNNLAVRKEK
jgi:F-type H+-transporting ATPase subunit epsilon